MRKKDARNVCDRNMGWEKIIDILNWAKDKLPIQDRKERWRNELDNLKKEKAEILINKADIKKANRLVYIERRIIDLEQLFRNQTEK